MIKHSSLDYSIKARRPNPYLPQLARIVRIIPMVTDNYFFTFRFEDPRLNERFDYKPGQFFELTVLGTGEAPISISSTPTRKGILECCIRRMGRVTQALYKLQENDLVGIRGPYGNGFPVDDLKAHNVILIAGGLGMAPVRGLLNYVLDRRNEFKRVILMYGARVPEDMLFRDELISLTHRQDIETKLIVEQAYNLPDALGWKGRIGLVTDLFETVQNVDSNDTYAVVCGPPGFYKVVLQKLLDRNFSKERILMSLERRMECGMGKCGHCAIGYKYTCIDGPVFTYWDILNLPEMI